jgi:putative oxidoreductase
MQILEKLKPLALLWLRFAVAVLFFFHGYQKLFGAPAAALQSFQRMGFPPYAVYVSGTLELFGAVLLVLGLLTRPVALLLALEMTFALVKAVPQASIYTVGNYDILLLLSAGAFTLAALGAGLFSIDAATFERSGGTSRPKSKK